MGGILLQAIIASFGYAGGVAVDKILLCREKLKVTTFVSILFAFLASITLFLIPKYGGIEQSFFSLKFFFVFVLLIATALTWNKLYYTSIQKESLHELELIMLLSPLATITFAMIFLPSERNVGVFIAALIASVAFVVSRIKKHHIKLSVTARSTILAMLLMSFESVLIKFLLEAMSPVTIYFVRTLVIAVALFVMYKPKNISSIPKKMFGLIFLSSCFGVINMILKFYGFKNLGVVETTLVLLLGPFLVYLFSYFYFHEKSYYKKDLACAIVVILCIVYSTVVK